MFASEKRRKSEKVFKQIQANSKIEICAFNGTDKWIRVQAKAIVDDRREAKQFMLDTYPDCARLKPCF